MSYACFSILIDLYMYIYICVCVLLLLKYVFKHIINNNNSIM